REELKKEGTGERRMGFRKVCIAVEKDYLNETGEHVTINPKTVCSRYNGTPSLHETRANQSLITPEEDKVIIDTLNECARQGFPWTHARLAEIANNIVR
ncbi:hypothetical protein CONPUDRAFT_17717, partial [Coniophora puteana RWD-64-598 SS2]